MILREGRTSRSTSAATAECTEELLKYIFWRTSTTKTETLEPSTKPSCTRSKGVLTPGVRIKTWLLRSSAVLIVGFPLLFVL